MKKSKRSLSVVPALVCTVCLMGNLNVQATEIGEKTTQVSPPVFIVQADPQADPRLAHYIVVGSGSNADGNKFSGVGTATTVEDIDTEITVAIQSKKNTDSTWTTDYTWPSDTFNGKGTFSVKISWYMSRGYDYRLKTTVLGSANGRPLESATQYSPVQSY